MDAITRYPRTRHVEGSRLQAGDEDLDQVPWAELAGRHLVVEEKMDGANAGLSFSADGALRLQSRGHYLTGGTRERHFALFKTWASVHQAALRAVLGARYLMYGEWLYAKHTVFYDRLPHYFMEFDVLDQRTGSFLSTPDREALLAPLRPTVVSVRVLSSGPLERLEQLTALVGRSAFQSADHLGRLDVEVAALGLDPERARRETDPTDLMEGLYIKHETDGEVRGRYKWVRASFLDAVARAEGHWLARPIVPNPLTDDVDLFAPE